MFQCNATLNGHNGEYNGCRAPQSRPGNQDLLAQGRSQWGQQNRGHERSCDQGQECGDGSSRKPHGGDPGREGEQSQDKEDQHLHQAGKAVKEIDQGFLIRQWTVA